jgi:hypothetical protein
VLLKSAEKKLYIKEDYAAPERETYKARIHNLLANEDYAATERDDRDA